MRAENFLDLAIDLIKGAKGMEFKKKRKAPPFSVSVWLTGNLVVPQEKEV